MTADDDDEPEIVYLGTITRDDKEEEEVKRLLGASTLSADPEK